MIEWLRRHLYIHTILEGNIDAVNRMRRLQQDVDQLKTILPALGRILAKLDPDYSTSDIDPAKRAESDRIGEEAIRRIHAEDMARRHTTGEL